MLNEVVYMNRFLQVLFLLIFGLILFGCVDQTEYVSSKPNTALQSSTAKITPEMKPIAFRAINPTPNKFKALLSDRRTISRFRPWFTQRDGTANYQLYWGGYTRKYPKQSKGIALTELYWRYVYKNKSWSELPGIYQYATDFNAQRFDRLRRERLRIPLKVTDPGFQEYIGKAADKKIRLLNSNGVLLDWWHNNHRRFGNETKKQIKNARSKVAQSLRENLSASSLIMGNLNYSLDYSTHNILNGAYLEFYKSDKENTYPPSKLYEIENLLIQHNKKLQQPKIVAAEFWKVGKYKGKTISLDHAENYRRAKLFSAMVTVIADNGYVTYIIGNHECDCQDKIDFDYDFYNFDVGKPTSSFTPISRGIGIKEFEHGVIAYNITNREKTISLPHGDFVFPIKSGSFCRYVANGKFDCQK